jgi:hypothetical protein
MEHETNRASGKGGGADLQGAPNPVSTFESCACKSVARTKEDVDKTPQIAEGRTGKVPPLFYGKIAHQDRKYKKCSWHEQRCALPGLISLQRAAMLKREVEVP